ncbi:hypothetical protein AFI02nite_31800 [Aliivibrio fischeri]|uniref:Uncharacterized protein n=1 Tax=Aliivibrio fischeri TaxID=668 RepID=A0A510UKH6_ALIFS|nr:hypothetical protein AFI02nite_31800 [Aliivibrio fischeri]
MTRKNGFPAELLKKLSSAFTFVDNGSNKSGFGVNNKTQTIINEKKPSAMSS